MEPIEMMGACGYDCGACSIRQVPLDPVRAQDAIGWYREMGWLDQDEGIEEAIAKGMYCQGCRGNRETHWSADCAILLCCVDEKGLEHCAQCADFSCEQVTEFENDGHGQHREAVARLRRIAGQ